MTFQYKTWKPEEIIFALCAFAVVLYVHGAIPFLMLPTLGQAVWATGFSQSMANGSLFDFYAHDFGIPKPAAIAFGLAGAWPASLLIRIGMHAADAYAAMAAFWLGLAMFSAYRIARWFDGTRLIALALAIVWMTMPIIWTHADFSMLSLGIALLSFYFLAAFKLFLFDVDLSKISSASIARYAIAVVVSVFMDGYTFMMFAAGSSMLLLYILLTRVGARSKILKVALPVHVASFTLAYALYSFYIGKSNFEAHQLDFFRGWGLDLSFLAIPTKGILWLPDVLDISVTRSDELYFGDGSVWTTTFALPILILGFFSWLRIKRATTISTGILLVSVFGFYMALGPSLKINSVKPEDLQSSQPRQLSALMASKYAVAPTGNAWISENLPGFNIMRASYRWSALGIFALWLLIVIGISRAGKKEVRVWLVLLTLLLLLNLPNPEKKWRGGIDNRLMFQQIDQELVEAFHQNIRPNETVVFLPWGNDFIANYLAPKAGFRTFNIGGDKNLSAAQSWWPRRMLPLGGEIDVDKATSAMKLLIDGSADVIVLPYFHMLWSAHLWPCIDKTNAGLTDKEQNNLRNIPGFLCPSERKSELEPVIAALRALPYVEVTEADLFTTVRLRAKFVGQANRLALLSSLVGSMRYPVSIGPGFAEAPYVLLDGWHALEADHVWSTSAASLLLPIPKYCEAEKCRFKIIFWVFGASSVRPLDVFFKSAEPAWHWSEEITAVSGDPIALNVPLVGGSGLRRINLSIPDATSPQHLIGSPDSRTLGISLQRVEVLRP